MIHEFLLAWRGFSVDEATWESHSDMAVDVPEMVTKFMESLNDLGRGDLLESSHGEVLCCA
jgi:hypothetical protein